MSCLCAASCPSLNRNPRYNQDSCHTGFHGHGHRVWEHILHRSRPQATTSKWRSRSVSLRATLMPSRTGLRREFHPPKPATSRSQGRVDTDGHQSSRSQAHLLMEFEAQPVAVELDRMFTRTAEASTGPQRYCKSCELRRTSRRHS